METTEIAAEADAGGIDWLAVAHYSLLVVFNGIFAIIMYTIGTFGNFMSIVIFIKRAKIDRVSSQYLGLLAVSDMLFLIIIGMVTWVNNDLPTAIRTLGGTLDTDMMPDAFGCKFWVYTMNVLNLISSWTLIVFSGERALVMWMPLRMGAVFSSSKPRKIALSLVVIGALLICSGHFHFITKDDNGDCWGRDDIPRWQNILSNIIFFGLPYAAPLVLISILNILILMGIKRNTMTNDKSKKSSKTERRCTINLLLVSFFFFILITPTTVIANIFFYYQWTGFAGLSEEYLVHFGLMHTVSQTLSTFNSVINPFLYTYSLDFYRKELLRILCPFWKGAKRDISTKTTSETAITDAADYSTDHE